MENAIIVQVAPDKLRHHISSVLHRISSVLHWISTVSTPDKLRSHWISSAVAPDKLRPTPDIS